MLVVWGLFPFDYGSYTSSSDSDIMNGILDVYLNVGIARDGP